MTKDDLKELVVAMRELGVTKLQDGPVVIELAPAAPAAPPEKDPSKPDYPATAPGSTDAMKKLEMLFKHSSRKPYRSVPRTE